MPRKPWVLMLAVLVALSAACGGSSKAAPPANQAFVPAGQETVPAVGAAAPTVAASPTPDLAAIARASGCTITPYAGSQPAGFGAPLQYPNWYSSGDLWLAPIAPAAIGLPKASGPWYAGPTSVAIVTPSGDAQEPKLTGQRLDGSASLSVRPGGATGVFILDFPSSGCWQVTVTAAGQALTLTAYVESLDARPDVAALLADHKELQPYPVPSSCSATSWKGPEDRIAQNDAEYWLDGEGIMAGSHSGLLWAGSENTVEWWPAGIAALTIAGHARSDPSTALRISLNDTAAQEGQHWTSTLVFPTAGCWEIAAKAGSQSLTAVVYVYPEACNRGPGTPVPSDCRPPSS